MKGVKVRAPEGLAAEIFREVGATPVSIPFSEVVIFSFFLTGESSLSASITMVDEASASASS